MHVEPIVPPPVAERPIDDAEAARRAATGAGRAKDALERALEGLGPIFKPALRHDAERHRAAMEDALAEAQEAVVALADLPAHPAVHAVAMRDLHLARDEADQAVAHLRGDGPIPERAAKVARCVRLATGVLDRAMAVLADGIQDPAHPGTNEPVLV